MLDVDRRAFVAGIGASTLPVPTLAEAGGKRTLRDGGEILEDQLGLSKATATAMTSRARRWTGEFTTILAGSGDGRLVELWAPSRKGTWLIRGNNVGEALLANAIAFICQRAQAQVDRTGASFRWFSGCSFGGASAHLFRGNKSALFLVTREVPMSVQPKRLDIVFV